MSIFSSIKARRPRRNVFDLSHEFKMTCNMGELIPFMCQDVVPGDSFRVSTESLVRLAPMIAPIMHRVNVFCHYFFVPNRLIWSEWEDFITKGVDGTDAPVFPTVTLANQDMQPGTLADYFGIGYGTNTAQDKVSALPFRAYQLIYDEYYRDQNLQDPVAIPPTSGTVLPANKAALLTIRNRAWEKDYFTSALPWVQRGPDVTLPLSGSAPVVLNSSGFNPVLVSSSGTATPKAGQHVVVQGVSGTGTNSKATLGVVDDSGSYVGSFNKIDPNGSLEADLSNAGAATVNELRRSIALQHWFEKNARGGSRYIEQILSHFGVRSSDARLQRPEFLGGGKQPVIVSEVLQTSQSSGNSPQANMAGHGISAGTTFQFKKFFEEHGFVIGIFSVLPRTAYQQGIPRKFLKFDNTDYYFPDFAHLGEQPIYNKELYLTGVEATDDAVFGYTPRYAEYKYEPSRVSGDFRSSLSFWHLGRIFSSAPQLNANFVTSDPSSRVFAVEDSTTDKLWIQLYNNIRAKRPMPKYGTPGLNSI